MSKETNKTKSPLSKNKEGEGKTTKPGEVKTTTSEGKTTKTGEGKTTKPSDGKTTKPSEGKTTKPGEGKATKPSEGKTTKPGEGKTTKLTKTTKPTKKGGDSDDVVLEQLGIQENKTRKRAGELFLGEDKEKIPKVLRSNPQKYRYKPTDPIKATPVPVKSSPNYNAQPVLQDNPSDKYKDENFIKSQQKTSADYAATTPPTSEATNKGENPTQFDIQTKNNNKNANYNNTTNNNTNSTNNSTNSNNSNSTNSNTNSNNSNTNNPNPNSTNPNTNSTNSNPNTNSNASDYTASDNDYNDYDDETTDSENNDRDYIPNPNNKKREKTTDNEPLIDLADVEIPDDYKKLDSEDILRIASLHKQIRAIAKDGNRKRWLSIIILSLMFVFVVLFIVAALIQNNGNFTISLNPNSINKGLTLFDNSSLTNGSSKLYTDSVGDCDNTTYGDIVNNLYTIDNVDGSHNTSTYFAYTFFVANNGNGVLDYSLQVNIHSAAKGLEEAVRVMAIEDSTYNGAKDNVRVPKVVAKPNANGEMDKLFDNNGNLLAAQDNAQPFYSNTIAYYRKFEGLYSSKSGKSKQSLHKYTILVYMEGGDKDCVSLLKGGQIKMSIELNVLVGRFSGDI